MEDWISCDLYVSEGRRESAPRTLIETSLGNLSHSYTLARLFPASIISFRQPCPSSQPLYISLTPVLVRRSDLDNNGSYPGLEMLAGGGESGKRR